MIKTFAVNAAGRIYLDNSGNLAVLEGLPAVIQICKNAVRTIKGEQAFNTKAGMPTFQAVWQVGIPNIPQFQAALRNAILGVEGVTAANVIQTSISSGVLSYTALITTIYGAGDISGSIPI